MTFKKFDNEKSSSQLLSHQLKSAKKTWLNPGITSFFVKVFCVIVSKNLAAGNNLKAVDFFFTSNKIVCSAKAG